MIRFVIKQNKSIHSLTVAKQGREPDLQSEGMLRAQER